MRALQQLIAEHAPSGGGGAGAATWAQPNADWEDTDSIDQPVDSDRGLAEDDSESGHPKKHYTFGRLADWILSKLRPDYVADTDQAQGGQLVALNSRKDGFEYVARSQPGSGEDAAGVAAIVDARVDGFARSDGTGNDELMPTANLADPPASFEDQGANAMSQTDGVLAHDETANEYKSASPAQVRVAGGGITSADVKPHARTGGAGTPPHEVPLLDHAPEAGQNVKDVVAQDMSPKEATGRYDATEGNWHFTISIEGVEFGLEYAPVGGSGTAQNRGQMELGGSLDDFASDAIPWRENIVGITIQVEQHDLFDVPMTTDAGIADGRGLISAAFPSNPTGLGVPAQPTDTVDITFDLMFQDGSNLYHGQWESRLLTRNAANVPVDTVNFDGNLTAAENTVQKALEKIDDLDVGELDAADVKEYARTGQRKIAASDLQTKGEEVIGAFDGAGYVAAGGVTQLRAATYTAADIAGQDFAASSTQGPHLENNYIGLRIPLAAKDDLDSYRLYIGENDGEDYHTLYAATGWTHLADDAQFAYYTQQVTDHPAGDWFGVQVYDQLRLDDEAGTATVDAVLAVGEGLRKTVTDTGVTIEATAGGRGAHIVDVLDRTDISVAITDAAADKLGVPIYFPLETLNIGTPAQPGSSGIFLIELEYRFSGSSVANFGFSAAAGGGDATARDDHAETASALRATAAFVTGGALEGIRFGQDLFSGVTNMGSADFRLTRASNGRAGVYLSFDSNQSSAQGAVTVTVNATIRFIANDPGPAASGGGTTQALNRSDYESIVQPSLANTNITVDTVIDVLLSAFLAGSDDSGQGLSRNAAGTRLVAARAGTYFLAAGLECSIHDSNTGSPISQGTRNYFDLRFYKSASGTAQAKTPLRSSQDEAYFRAADNTVGRGQSPAAEVRGIGTPVKLAAGEAVGIELVGRHNQGNVSTIQVNVAQSNSEFRINSFEYTLA